MFPRLALPMWAVLGLLQACSVGQTLPTGIQARVQVARSEASVKTAPSELIQSAVFLSSPSGICSGVLVTPWRILTAAHCLDGLSLGERATIRFGVDMRTPSAVVPGAGRVRIHPLVDLGTIDLSEAAPSSAVPARLLGEADGIERGEELVFGGFGKTADTLSNAGQFLRWGKLFFDRFDLAIVYATGRTFRSVLTFLPGAKGSSACGGDSGGPLLKATADGFGLAGIISGGHQPCEADGAPTYTADARPNADWIFSDTVAEVAARTALASPGSCVVSAQSSAVNGLNVRSFDDVSALQGAVMEGTTLPFFSKTSAQSRWQVRIAGFVHASETNCLGDIATCAPGLAATGKSFQLADAFGSALRIAPGHDAAIAAIAQPGTRLRLTERVGAWHRVDFIGTVSRRFCDRLGVP